MLRRFPVRPCLLLVGLLVAGPLGSASGQAFAQDDPSCRAIEGAQTLVAADRFREARALLQQCVNAQCGGDVRRRCAVELQQLNQVTPSVVVRVEDERGNDLVDVEVRLGGETLATSLDGMAIPVDPGVHSFELRRPGFEPVTTTLTIARGEKFRSLDVRLGPGSADGSSASDGGLSTAQLASGLSLVSVGAAGIVGFAWLGTKARSQERDLTECSPRCSEGRVDRVRKRYVLANVSLGAGVLALGGATWLFLSGLDFGGGNDASGIDVGLLPGGGYATYGGSF